MRPQRCAAQMQRNNHFTPFQTRDHAQPRVRRGGSRARAPRPKSSHPLRDLIIDDAVTGQACRGLVFTVTNPQLARCTLVLYGKADFVIRTTGASVQDDGASPASGPLGIVESSCFRASQDEGWARQRIGTPGADDREEPQGSRTRTREDGALDQCQPTQPNWRSGVGLRLRTRPKSSKQEP